MAFQLEISFWENILATHGLFTFKNSNLYKVVEEVGLENIVLETGINLDAVPQEDIDILLEKASDIYDIDKNMLAVLISKPHQYSLTVTGGMGLTTISCYDFLNSSFSNPYNSEENIMAAAETISRLQKSGMLPEDIIIRFIAGRNQSDVEVLANSEYERAHLIANTYRINHAGLK